MKKGILLVLILVFAVALAACGNNNSVNNNANESATNTSSGAGTDTNNQPAAEEPVVEEPVELTITHDLGEVVVKKNPKNVVVFDFGTLDTLTKLGVEVLGVPKNNLPSYLNQYDTGAYKSVGGLTEPDFEAVNALEPELIIISGRQSASYEEFARIAPTVFISLDTTKYMESFSANATMLGEIFGKEAEVAAELETIKSSVKTVNETAVASGKNALVILTNAGKISAYGAGSRFGVIHSDFGMTPVDEAIEVSTHGMSVSFEYIAEKNPDYLFVVDRSAVVGADAATATAKDTIENDLVKNTNAYKDDNIVYLDPNYWYLSGGGLISVTEMVNEIAAGLK